MTTCLLAKKKSKTTQTTRKVYRGTRRAIVIVTCDIDPHSDVMVLKLERRGVRPVRFHPERIGQTDGMTTRFGSSSGCEWMVESPAGRLASDEVGSIWYRRTYFAQNSDLPPNEAAFSEAETQAAVLGMLRVTDAFWVSHPDALRVAESKPYQLKVAQDLGFRIPRTLLSNDPDAFVDFYNQCAGNVVYKPLTQGAIGDDECAGVFTNKIRSEHLCELEAIACTPCVFQEHVPKTLDLRVTAIGNQLFPVAIYSQVAEASRTDWRRGNPTALKHEVHKLPREIEQKCLRLLERLNLQFGAIDLVLTPDDEYVFLEINPSGQFGWIEQLTKLPLTETLADLLISNC